VLIAADEDAGAEVDGAGADVCTGPPAEVLLPELHAAAATMSVAPAASAGMTVTARPVVRETCWWPTGWAFDRGLEKIISLPFPLHWR
jgi:hypothetical protein